MNKQRFLALLTAVVLLCLPALSLAEVTYPLDPPMSLSWWMPLNAGAAKYITSYDENTAYAQMEKDTGVDIQWIHPAVGQVQEQFNMMLVSGQLPDLISGAKRYAGGEFQGMRDGVFVNLTEYLPTYAPDYWALIQSDEEFRRCVTDSEGNIAAFCAYKEAGDPPSTRLIVHKSVMDQLGAEVPETVADWDALFEGMKGLGITPYLLESNGLSKIFMGAFGTYPGFYVNLDKQVTFGYVTEEFRAYLTQMHEWYEKDYICKDFTSIDTVTMQTMFDAGDLGCVTDAIVATYNRAQRQGSVILSTPYPRLKEGDVLHWLDENVSPRQDFDECTTVISTSCKNIEAAVSLLNYAYTGKGIELLNWGVEGLNWDWVDGKRVYNDLMLNNEVYSTDEASFIYKAHMATKYTQAATTCHANLLKSPESLAIRFQYTDDPNMDSAFFAPSFDLSEEEAMRKSEIMPNVNTYVREMVLKFIVGAEPLENFDAFVDTVNGMGLPEVLDMMQRGYERYMSK